jgi:uncharacterized protein YkwD
VPQPIALDSTRAVIVLKLYLVLPLLLLFAASAVPTVEDDAGTRQALLDSLNRERAAAGLAPLLLDETLSQVAQRSAEEIRDHDAEPPRQEDIRQIRLLVTRAGYEAHGWSHSFVAMAGDVASVVSWWKEQNDATFRHPDYRDVGIGITDFCGTPLYTFLFAWRESEYFARETAPLLDLERVRAGMLAEVNARRAESGAPPLTLDPRLDGAAQRHAEDMLRRSYYDHESLEGLRPRDRVAQAGYQTGLVAENIARGPTSVADVMSAWMQSRGHRSNLLNPAFREMGIGCAVGHNAAGDTVLWVQDFGRPGS